MKNLLSRPISLVLACAIFLVSCSSTPSGFTGNYQTDTLALIDSLQATIELPQDAPEKRQAQMESRQQINDFAAIYRREPSIAGLASFTTMLTAINSLAAHYGYYSNRPVPEKLKKRLAVEFKQVRAALKRGT